MMLARFLRRLWASIQSTRGCRHDWGEYESHYPCWTTATCKKCGEMEIF